VTNLPEDALINRIESPELRAKVTTAGEAAEFISHGDNVGMSGFTGAGCPKLVPAALAHRAEEFHARGEEFRIGLWTGASTSPEVDGVLARAHAISSRLPYNSDPDLRAQINSGEVDYIEPHLSHSAQQLRFGFYGPLNVAVIEVVAVLPDGRLVPSTSVGNNKAWLDQADVVILEVNSWQPRGLEGFHDIYHAMAVPPARQPLELTEPMQTLGDPYLRVDLDKVVAVVETNEPDSGSEFTAPDSVSEAIAQHVLDFLAREIEVGRMPAELLPIQSGVSATSRTLCCTASNRAVIATSWPIAKYSKTACSTYWTQVCLRQPRLFRSAFRPKVSNAFGDNIEDYRGRILLRSESITNHPEIIRRLGVIAMNSMVEADIYGNVNSTHVMGSAVINGIGGSGDFARNSYVNFFLSPSTAKGGAISAIVPMVSHTDHTEHDVHVIVTEWGLADLRGLSPISRAKQIIENCAHPDYRDALRDYVERACKERPHARHTPHILTEALSWHQRFLETGKM
jgi:succinyl-CoA:acetate CoA-transferase